MNNDEEIEWKPTWRDFPGAQAFFGPKQPINKGLQLSGWIRFWSFFFGPITHILPPVELAQKQNDEWLSSLSGDGEEKAFLLNEDSTTFLLDWQIQQWRDLNAGRVQLDARAGSLLTFLSAFVGAVIGLMKLGPIVAERLDASSRPDFGWAGIIGLICLFFAAVFILQTRLPLYWLPPPRFGQLAHIAKDEWITDLPRLRMMATLLTDSACVGCQQALAWCSRRLIWATLLTLVGVFFIVLDLLIN